MPALNVDFSEDELADLRAVASERGVTLKALVRKAVTDDLAHHRALQEGAEAFRRFFAENAEAFAEAFPEDEPAARAEQRAA